MFYSDIFYNVSMGDAFLTFYTISIQTYWHTYCKPARLLTLHICDLAMHGPVQGLAMASQTTTLCSKYSVNTSLLLIW